MGQAEGLDRLRQDVTHEVRRVERSWPGLRMFAPAHIPVVGFDPRTERFWWRAGQRGIAMMTSPALATGMAAGLLGRPSMLPSDTRAATTPARFF